MNRNADDTDKVRQYDGINFFTLLDKLRHECADMLKAEIDLLKSELSEKLSSAGKQLAMVATGGVIALTGGILMMVGLCLLISYGLQKAGLSASMAMWISFLLWGGIVTGIGYGFLKKALATLSATSFAPAATIATSRELATGEATAGGIVASSDLKSENGVKVQKARAVAEEKIETIQNEIASLQNRLKPQYLWNATCAALKRRPRASAGIGAAAIAVGYLAARRHARKAKRARQLYELVLD